MFLDMVNDIGRLNVGEWIKKKQKLYYRRFNGGGVEGL